MVQAHGWVTVASESAAVGNQEGNWCSQGGRQSSATPQEYHTYLVGAAQESSSLKEAVAEVAVDTRDRAAAEPVELPGPCSSASMNYADLLHARDGVYRSKQAGGAATWHTFSASSKFLTGQSWRFT